MDIYFNFLGVLGLELLDHEITVLFGVFLRQGLALSLRMECSGTIIDHCNLMGPSKSSLPSLLGR